jgi:microcompartment protein CcmL/EutN
VVEAAVPHPLQPALGLVELDSIAVGIETGDAMVKRAPVDVVHAGTIHPGRYLVLVAGTVGDVEEAMAAGRVVGGPSLVATVFLPNVHDQLVAALRGRRRVGIGEALGVVETATVSGAIEAADAGVKGAAVQLLELRLGDGIGGKGYLLFDGSVSAVEAAVAVALDRLAGLAVAMDAPGGRAPVARVIPQLHREMRAELEAAPRFHARLGTTGGEA